MVFTLIAFDSLGGHADTGSLVEITTWAILLSVLAHGLSSGRLRP